MDDLHFMLWFIGIPVAANLVSTFALVGTIVYLIKQNSKGKNERRL